MKYIVSTILILILAPMALVYAYTSPGSPDGYVSDFAGVISNEVEQELELRLGAYEQQTGNEIAVVTIPALIDETVETYAVRLFEEWGIGKKGRDNGVLFLVARDDRTMRIEVGYGLEGDLTDVESKAIIANTAAPHFKENDFDTGVRRSIDGILSAIGGDAAAAALGVEGGNASWTLGRVIGEFFWIFLFIFIWMSSVFARSRSWWAGGVVGAIAGIIIGLVSGIWWWLPVLVVLGLVFDYLISTRFKRYFVNGHKHSAWPWLMLMGGRPGRWDKGGRGGLGGFGGGFSGGGGASGDW